MDRRSFFVILLGAPLAAKLLPLLPTPSAVLYTGGLEQYIAANVWSTPPPVTEAMFIEYLEIALRSQYKSKFAIRTFHGDVIP